MKLYEQAGNKGKMAEVFTNMATVYASMNDTAKTKSYIAQSEALQYAKNKKKIVISNLVNIGISYGTIGEYQKSLDAFTKGFHFADSVHDQYWRSITLADLAQANSTMGNLDGAFANYNDLLKDSNNIKDPGIVMMAYIGKGNILIQKKKIKEGIKLMTIAYDFYSKAGQKDAAFQAAHELTEAYEAIHDYPNALKFHKIYFAYKDTLYDQGSAKSIQQLQFDYQLEKKQNQIELLKKDKLLESEKIENQRTLTVTLLIGLVLLVIIIALLVRSRQYEKTNKELFFRQKEEIQLQATKLEDLNGFKDKTFSVLSHDLRSPLATLTGTMELLDLDLITLEEFGEMRPELNKRLKSLNILLDNLLQWSESYMKGDAAVVPERIDMQVIAETNVHLMQENARKKQITINYTINTPLYAWADAGQIDIVVRNLLGNAVKFTTPGGSITLSAIEDAVNVVVSVADTGVGMTTDQLDRLFTASADNHTYGTGGEKGIGLGLLLCYEFIKVNKGILSVKSELNRGTVFTFTIPKYTAVDK